MNENNAMNLNPTWQGKWEDLDIKNAFIFAKVMQDKEACRSLIETLLNVKVRHIEYLNTEHTIDVYLGNKGIRLDVYVEEQYRMFAIEMQVANEYNIGLRMRYYQAMMDADSINKGTKYDELPENYVLFICPFNLFPDRKEAILTFRNTCQEDTTLHLKDNCTKIFYNVVNYQQATDQAAQNLLRYIATGEKTDQTTERLDQLVVKTKRNSKWRTQFMTVGDEMEILKRRCLEYGREQGRAESAEEIARLKAQIAELQKTAETAK